jgi:TolB protein
MLGQRAVIVAVVIVVSAGAAFAVERTPTEPFPSGLTGRDGSATAGPTPSGGATASARGGHATGSRATTGAHGATGSRDAANVLTASSSARTRTSTRRESASATTTTAPPQVTTTTVAAARRRVARVPLGDIVYDGGVGKDHFEIFRMKPDGSGIVQLTDDAAYNSWWPRPSPDRTKILFYRTPDGYIPPTYDNAALWVMNANGGDAHVIVPARANGWTFQAHGEWSPDGTRIVFTGGSVQALIMTVAPDGSDLQVLGGGPGANVDPTYSADGQWIVYVGCPSVNCNFQTTEVFKMPAAGGTRVRLTSDTYRDQDPVLSPDGRTVAFLTQTVAPGPSLPFGSWQLRTVDADGTNARQITGGSALCSAPRWSPDGTRIWTHRNANDIYAWDLASMNSDGSGLTQISLPYTQEFLAFAT